MYGDTNKQTNKQQTNENKCGTKLYKMAHFKTHCYSSLPGYRWHRQIADRERGGRGCFPGRSPHWPGELSFSLTASTCPHFAPLLSSFPQTHSKQQDSCLCHTLEGRGGGGDNISVLHYYKPFIPTGHQISHQASVGWMRMWCNFSKEICTNTYIVMHYWQTTSTEGELSLMHNSFRRRPRL